MLPNNKSPDNTTSLPLFDTHAHLDLPPFANGRTALVQRLESGTFPGGLPPQELEEELQEQQIKMVGVLIPGIDAAGCQKVHEIAAMSDLLHAAAAIHPNHTAEATDEDWKIIADLAQNDDVIAIGETGLDLYWDSSPPDVQIEMLHRHFNLARQTNKPMIIHCRDAWDVLLPLLQQYGQPSGQANGIIHAFSGTVEQMFACVELGYYISFAGAVTYRNTKYSALWEAAKQTPLERLLIETDAPFMTPHPLRGKVPCNEPTLVALTALRLAELREVSLKTIAEATTHNALKALNLDDK